MTTSEKKNTTLLLTADEAWELWLAYQAGLERYEIQNADAHKGVHKAMIALRRQLSWPKSAM